VASRLGVVLRSAKGGCLVYSPSAERIEKGSRMKTLSRNAGMLRLGRIAIGLGAVVGATALVVLSLTNVSTAAARRSATPSSVCDTTLTPTQEIQELADTIRASAGKPTSAGKAILQANAAGDPSLAASVLSAASATDGSMPGSVQAVILATQAKPLPASNAGVLAAVRHDSPSAPRAASRATAGRFATKVARRLSWGGYYYYYCGGGVRANLQFWCKAGGSCAATAFFSDFEVISSTFPYCKGPGPGSGLTLARAQPGHSTIWVDWIRPYQGVTGAPKGYAQWCGL
jgi:hypothetical protein